MSEKWVKTNVVDVKEGILRRDCWVQISGDRIGAVGPDGPSGNVETEDRTDSYMMPGIIDCHVHILMDMDGSDPIASMVNVGTEELVFRAMENLKRLLNSGITYFRDMGGHNFTDIKIRDAVNSGRILGPEMKASGHMISMTGGHAWIAARECDGVDEAVKAVREQVKNGADIIKIMATGGYHTPGCAPGSEQFSREEIRAMVSEAHRLNKKVTAHAQGVQAIRYCVDAGIDCIEHGDFLVDAPEVIDQIVEKGIFVVPTICTRIKVLENAIKNGAPQAKIDRMRLGERHIDSFRLMMEKGVKLANGTDTGIQNDSLYEIELMEKYGMPTAEVLKTATLNSARCLGIEDQYGSIENGKFADLVLMKENPLEHATAVRNITEVYKKGRKVKGGQM